MNRYATVEEYKAYAVSRGQSDSISHDTKDDGVIRDLLAAASREIDRGTGRFFYPLIDTFYYDVPSGREMKLRHDLLEVITLTNGNASTISSTYYNLIEKNSPPYWAIRLKENSSVSWTSSSTESEFVISLNAWFGYHEHYSNFAWISVGTLGAEMADTSTKSLTMTASHSVTVDMIIKIESEIFNIDTVATNTVTMNYRGDNGSTAATHANGTTVYAWMTMEDVRKATLDITAHAYKRRFGESQSETARITAVGILLSPNDVPSSAKSLMASLRRIT